MERWLYARQAIIGSPKRLRDTLVGSVPGLLQAATDTPPTAPAGDGSVDLSLRARIGGLEVEKQVRATVGEVRYVDNWLRIPLRWVADPGRQLFPEFSGAIELTELSATRSELEVFGGYDPPMGRIGDVGDIMLFHDLAEQVVKRLGRQLADVLRQTAFGEAPARVLREGVLTVGDVMTADPLMFGEEQPLRAAAALMLRARISGAPVMDDTGEVVGVLSDRDLLDKAATPPSRHRDEGDEGSRRRQAMTVGEACSRPARTTATTTSIRDAAREMVRRSVGRLVVLDGARVVGIVARGDVLKALARQDEDTAEDIVVALTELNQPGLVADVENGVVSMRGVLANHRDAEVVADRIAEISGVLDIRMSGVTWTVDDGMPTIMPMT